MVVGIFADYRKTGNEGKILRHLPTPCLIVFPQISVRVDPDQPNHHIWNNNGTWFMHYVVLLSPSRRKRIRFSLGTRDVEEARSIRDQFLSDFYKDESITEVMDYKGRIAIRSRF